MTPRLNDARRVIAGSGEASSGLEAERVRQREFPRKKQEQAMFCAAISGRVVI